MKYLNPTLRILSIDWDYFIDADISQRYQLFPDTPSEKYSEKLQNIIWTSRYSDKELINIPVNHAALNQLENFLLNSPNEIYLAETHTLCYYLIKKIKEHYQSLILTNIDHHHDVYYSSYKKEIQCGNWLYHIIKENPKGQYTWVKNPDSEIFNKNKLTKKLKVSTDLETILKQEYDIVFFCQSAMWTPPHLDKYYLDIFDRIKHKTVTLEAKAWKNRYTYYQRSKQCQQ